jgi:hypothetical protein
VQLFGNGYKNSPSILASAPKQNNLICQDELSDTIHIKNIGKDTLKISSINILGDTNDYSVQNSKCNVLSGDSINLIYHFKADTIGIKQAAIKITSNADPDSVLIIPLSARKDSIGLSINGTESDTIEIDLGTICPEANIDSIITIINKSTIGTTFIIDKIDLPFQLQKMEKREAKKEETK